MSTTLDAQTVLIVDCQATAPAPRGHIIELGWAIARPDGVSIETRLVQLPGRAHVPPAVARVTGLCDASLGNGVTPESAWDDFAGAAATLEERPVPAVAHFAQYERPFLRQVANTTPPLDLVCTHAIARRLLPSLPRCSLRALTGYFGRGVGSLRRSGDHVDATAFVWRHLIALLAAEGVSTWPELQHWLTATRRPRRTTRRAWPMPRALRLAVPDAPGIYRMLRTNGDILYVGKAVSLKHRVNSYFRKQRGMAERTLEMLSQARSLSFEVTATALEAALVEADEIKRHETPYNVALSVGDRGVWFSSTDFRHRAPRVSPQHPLGPFPSPQLLDGFAALLRDDRAALGDARWGPSPAVFASGLAALRSTHDELRSSAGSPARAFLQLGARLWLASRGAEADPDEWTLVAEPSTTWTTDTVRVALEQLVVGAALAVRRARWLARLADASILFAEPGVEGGRLLVFDRGECVERADATRHADPPEPPGGARRLAERREAFTLARFDRVRVLTTELKRLVAAEAPVSVRLGRGPALTGARLARVFRWI